MGKDGDRVGKKAGELAALSRSVADTPTDAATAGRGSDLAYVFWVAGVAETITPWGQNPRYRDVQLRQFFPTENYLASALGSVSARNAAFNWTLEGPDRTVRAAQDMLLNANWGRGWEEFIIQFSLDLYTQDRGTWVELVRTHDSPTAAVIGINHLDSSRCYSTGVAKEPTGYEDRQGRIHILKHYQVAHLTEMPAPVETRQGVFDVLQYSAATRALRAAQILRNIAIFKEEKTGGRFERAVHLVKGVTSKQISDALAQHRDKADQQGLLRYVQPLVVGSIDPAGDIGHDTIELASLPDNFDEDTIMKWYIASLAMALLVDYQELAPLPGGNLGTSAQSWILHMKARGKGPALFQKIITHLLNRRGVLPRNVEFQFAEPDVEHEREEAELAKVRADERAVRLMSGEITPSISRQLAVDAGDLTQEIFESMGGLDVTPHVTVEDTEKPEQPKQQASEAEAVKVERRAGPEEVEEERIEVEDEVKHRALRALRSMRQRIRARLRKEASG